LLHQLRIQLTASYFECVPRNDAACDASVQKPAEARDGETERVGKRGSVRHEARFSTRPPIVGPERCVRRASGIQILDMRFSILPGLLFSQLNTWNLTVSGTQVSILSGPFPQGDLEHGNHSSQMCEAHRRE
jgi:hypothetical protein